MDSFFWPFNLMKSSIEKTRADIVVYVVFTAEMMYSTF